VTGGLLPKLLPLGIVTLLILAILGGIKLMTKPQAPENACETGNCNCTGLHLYDTQNNPLTADKISPGQTVRIGMGTTGTNVWKVRFKVNDGDWQETDQTKFSPQIGYYFDLPIPAAGGTFTITGNVCCGPVVTVTTEPGATPITQCVWK